MGVESCKSVLILLKKVTSWTPGGVSMVDKVSACDTHPPWSRIGSVSLRTVSRWKVVWVRSCFDLIQYTAVLRQWCLFDTKYSSLVPTGRWNEAKDGSGTDDVSPMKTNEILV